MLVNNYRKYEKELFNMVDQYVRNRTFYTNDQLDINIESMLDSEEYCQIAVKLFTLDFEDATEILNDEGAKAFKKMVLDPDMDNKAHFASVIRDNLLNHYEATIKQLIQDRFERIAAEDKL